MIIKTENNLMLCDFQKVKIEAYKPESEIIKQEEAWLVGKIVLNGYLASGEKILLRAFDGVEEAINTLNAIYQNVPGAVSLSPTDIPSHKELFDTALRNMG